MQTIVMQVLVSSAHVNDSRVSQTKLRHYLSLREDRFNTELRECFWNVGCAECSKKTAEWDCLLGGSEIPSSLQTSELSKSFPWVDFACKKTHQTLLKFIMNLKMYNFHVFIFQTKRLNAAHTCRNNCLLGKEQRPLFLRKSTGLNLINKCQRTLLVSNTPSYGKV